MARRGGEGGNAGMAAPLIGVAVNLLVFVILEIFAPTIAGTIQTGQPALGITSEWNNTFRTCAGPANYTHGCSGGVGGLGLTAIPTGADTWTTVIQIIGVVFLIIAIAIAIYYLKGMG